MYSNSTKSTKSLIKLNYMINKVPNLLIGGMEYVSSIFVDIDSVFILAVDIASRMRPFVYYQTFFIGKLCPVSECGAEQSAADYQIIIFIHGISNCRVSVS